MGIDFRVDGTGFFFHAGREADYYASMTLTETGAVVGAITGPLGLAISILAYWRDRPHLWVSLAPDMKVQNSERYDASKRYMVATVSNIGRRPEHVELVAVLQPDGTSGTIADVFFNPNEVHEGKAPAKYLIDQSSIAGFESQWPGISVLVRTSAGRQYRSRWLKHPPKECGSISPLQRTLLRARTRLKHPWAFRRHYLT